MSKYVIIHGQLHELSDDELMHWKYIKRERVNGKWKYYYSWDELKKDVQNMQGAEEKKKYEQAKKNYDTRKSQIERASMQRKPIADKESNWGDSLTRYWRVDSSGDKRGSYNKDGRYREQTRAIDTLKKEMNEAEREYRKTPLGRRESRAEKAKEVATKTKSWAKDKLGYDEKQKMESAKVAAKVARNAADDKAKRNAEWKERNPGNEKIKEMADWQNGFMYSLAAESWAKAKEATEKYEKTPLGKFEKLSEKIDSATAWYKQWRDDTNGVNDRITAENLEKAREKYEKVQVSANKEYAEYRDAKSKLDTSVNDQRRYERKMNEATDIVSKRAFQEAYDKARSEEKDLRKTLDGIRERREITSRVQNVLGEDLKEAEIARREYEDRIKKRNKR